MSKGKIVQMGTITFLPDGTLCIDHWQFAQDSEGDGVVFGDDGIVKTIAGYTPDELVHIWKEARGSREAAQPEEP